MFDPLVIICSLCSYDYLIEGPRVFALVNIAGFLASGCLVWSCTAPTALVIVSLDPLLELLFR